MTIKESQVSENEDSRHVNAQAKHRGFTRARFLQDCTLNHALGASVPCLVVMAVQLVPEKGKHCFSCGC
eukprot:1160058-Pelagomonas_calceolata.AAC.9